jgi:UDP-N-acetylglucosamine transferase subunit ALG13
VIAGAENHRELIERLALRFERVGPTLGELKPKIEAFQRDMSNLPAGDRREVSFVGRFARIEAPHRLQALKSVVAAWEPSLVVYESADIAAPIAAAAAGVSTANHSFGQPIAEAALRRAAEVVAPLWRAAGLKPDGFAGAFRGSYVDIWPPSLRTDTTPLRTRIHRLRPADAGEPGGTARDRPLIYATLGTAFNDLATFRLLLDALGEIDCDVVMTIGRNHSPCDLEPIPGNATVAQYITQAEVLVNCDAVVAHAGSGSVLAALAHGCPLVLLPRGADQFDNAAVCAEVGVAKTIMPTDISAAVVRSAVDQVLTDSAYAEAARSVAAEIAAMPSPAAVAGELAAQR